MSAQQLHRWQIQYLGATEFPNTISPVELAAFFTFSAKELDAINSRHKPNRRIAAAVQLGFLKMTGAPLSALRVIPPTLLKHLAKQVGGSPMNIATLRSIYQDRKRAMFEHQAWAMEVLGFTRAEDRQFRHLLPFPGRLGAELLALVLALRAHHADLRRCRTGDSLSRGLEPMARARRERSLIDVTPRVATTRVSFARCLRDPVLKMRAAELSHELRYVLRSVGAVAKVDEVTFEVGAIVDEKLQERLDIAVRSVAGRPLTPRMVVELLGITSRERLTWTRLGRLPQSGRIPVRAGNGATVATYDAQGILEIRKNPRLLKEWRAEDRESVTVAPSATPAQ